MHTSQQYDHHHDHQYAHDHAHGHVHDHRSTPLNALGWALGITVIIFVVQVIGALYSGSLALLSDSMHMLSDSTALILAVVASLIGRRAATSKATYGHHRVEVLAALVNGVAVAVVTVWILVSAFLRISHGSDHNIDSTVMAVVAVVGLIANLISAAILWRHQDESMNVRAAFLHVFADLIGSVFVIVAAIVIALTGFEFADIIASLVIVALVLPRAVRVLRDALNVLLERVPQHIDAERILVDLEAVDGVEKVHDLHVWSTDGTAVLATCHAVVDTSRSDTGCEVLDDLQKVLADHGIEHSTVQVEYPGHHLHERVCD